jgi:hypothetical protein
MSNPFTLPLAFRFVAAFTLLVSTVSPTRPFGVSTCSGRDFCLSRGIAAPSNHAVRLSATWMTARPERIKAIPSETGEELGRTVYQSGCVCDLPTSSSPQPLRYQSRTNSFRTSSLLRC